LTTMASAAEPSAKRTRMAEDASSLFGTGLTAKYLVKDGQLDLDSLKGKAILVCNTAST